MTVLTGDMASWRDRHMLPLGTAPASSQCLSRFCPSRSGLASGETAVDRRAYSCLRLQETWPAGARLLNTQPSFCRWAQRSPPVNAYPDSILRL